MKYKIIPTARFRKDVKTAAKRGLPLCRLEEIVDQLASGTPLPERTMHLQVHSQDIGNVISCQIGY